jgi:hypothetical protein
LDISLLKATLQTIADGEKLSRCAEKWSAAWVRAT